MKSEYTELFCQWLETEIGGVQVYKTALQCVINKDLRSEWEKYLEQTERHVEIVTQALTDLGFDPQTETPGRERSFVIKVKGRHIRDECFALFNSCGGRVTG